MIDEILLNDGIGEARAALLSDGLVQEIRIEREDRRSQVGDIVLGRVQKVVPSLSAAFVDLGHGRNGFLTLRDAAPLGRAKGRNASQTLPIERLVHEGEAIIVQVIKDGAGDKGPRVSADISLPGRTVALTPNEPGVRVSRRIGNKAERERLARTAEAALEDAGVEGAVVRTVAEGCDGEIVAGEVQTLAQVWADLTAKARTATVPVTLREDPGLLAGLVRDVLTDSVTRFEVDTTDALQRAKRLAKIMCPELEDRIVLHTGGAALFEDCGIEAEIDAALQARVSLTDGGWLAIEPTEGLIAIDVNAGTGADTGSGRSPATAVNLAAAKEIARQIRLRALSGLMVVDFIHVATPEDAGRLTRALESAFASDPVHTRISPMSEFGLVEITRRRDRESLAEMLETACPVCGGHGHVPRLDAEVQRVLRRAEREALAHRGGEVAVGVSAAVAERLTAGPTGASLLSRLEARIGKRVRLETAS